MKVDGAPSQTTILSAIAARTVLTSPAVGESGRSIAPAPSKLLDLSNEIDSGFVRSVTQDTVEKRLETALTDAGVDVSAQEALAQVGDASPEVTADRIVEFATGFLEQHKLAHADLAAGEQLDEFVSLIKGAIETGFEEVGGLLSQLGQVLGPVQAGIDKTVDLVNKGVDDFAGDTLSAIESASEASDRADSADTTTMV